MLTIERVPESQLPKNLFVAEVTYRSPDMKKGECLRSPQFGLSTYKRLSREWEKGEHIYRLANMFFAQMLSETEQKMMFDYYITMYNLIDSINRTDLNAIRDEMERLTTTVLAALQIPEKLLVFIEALNPPIPDDSAAGRRDHDTDEMTFLRPDYLVLTAMCTLSKFMSPIWGQYINKLKAPVAEDLVKELFCSYLIIPTLEGPVFGGAYNKLKNYLKKIVNNSTKQSSAQQSQITNTFVLSKSGVDMRRFLDTLYAITLTKKLVIYNVWEAEKDEELPDIMKYVNVGIITTAQTKVSLFRRQTNYLPRFDLAESSSAGSDNSTHNDHTARVSQATVDIPVIARVSTHLEVGRIITQYGLNRKAFNEAMRFHTQRIIVPNDINQSLTASFVGTRVGASKAVRYNRMRTYMEAVLVTQMFLIQMGLPHLAHFMTCNTDKNRRGKPLDNANSINNSIDKSPEYKMCMRRFQGHSTAPVNDYLSRMNPGKRVEMDSISIQTQLKSLTQWCADYPHTYNTAPSIWALIDGPTEMEGAEMEVPTDITKQIAGFFLRVHPDIPE